MKKIYHHYSLEGPDIDSIILEEAIMAIKELLSSPKEIIREIRWLFSPPSNLWTYFLGIFVGMIIFIRFCVFRQYNVVKLGKIHWRLNTILVTNHIDWPWDSLFIATVNFFPLLLIRPSLIPVHLAAEENFFKPNLIGRRILKKLKDTWLARIFNPVINAIFTFFFRSLRCYAVPEGRNDQKFLRKMNKKITDNVTHIFITKGVGPMDEKGDFTRRPVAYGPSFLALRNQSKVVIGFVDGFQKKRVPLWLILEELDITRYTTVEETTQALVDGIKNLWKISFEIKKTYRRRKI